MTWFATVFGFGSYLMFQDATLDKEKLSFYSGQIIDQGITDHSSSTKYGTKTSKVFYLRIKGLNQMLAVHNTGQEYSDLMNNLHVGDNVDVYYKTSIKTDEPNIDVYEIKTGDKIILSDKELRSKRKWGGIIAALGVGLVFVIGLIRDRRYQKGDD